MPSLKLSNPFRRSADRPSLKQRAAGLKATAARLMSRKADKAGADQGRRMMVAGSMAAVVAAPLPVLAGAILPVAVTAPHPDQALFDAEAEYLRALDAEKAAGTASAVASNALWKAIGPCPDALLIHERNDMFSCPGFPFWGRGVRFQFVRVAASSDVPWVQAWTAEGLERAIALAPQVLGRGGRTPHTIRAWRDLLPAAAAFDARRSALESQFNTKELSQLASESRTARGNAAVDLSSMKASTVEGLAVKARYVDGFDWHKMPSGWVSLLQSAALISGVALREPDFDPAKWVDAWKTAGGTIQRHPVTQEVMFCCPPDPVHSPEAKAEIARLRSELGANDAVIGRWVAGQI